MWPISETVFAREESVMIPPLLDFQELGVRIRLDEAAEVATSGSETEVTWEVVKEVDIVDNFAVDLRWKTEERRSFSSR